jgi:hypothetical protein
MTPVDACNISETGRQWQTMKEHGFVPETAKGLAGGSSKIEKVE